MIFQVFAVRDSKTEAFLPPFLSQNVPTAVRALSEFVADPKHLFGAHPVDFTLYHLGTWDDVAGRYEISPAPAEVIRLTEVKSSFTRE